MPSLSEETGGRVSMLMPGSTIGIIGGGQLGRMMALSARYMGFRVGVLDPTPNCPTGQVADFQITAEYDDRTAIHDLAVQSDVLTYEFENVDADAIDEVRGDIGLAGGLGGLRGQLVDLAAEAIHLILELLVLLGQRAVALLGFGEFRRSHLSRLIVLAGDGRRGLELLVFALQ